MTEIADLKQKLKKHSVRSAVGMDNVAYKTVTCIMNVTLAELLQGCLDWCDSLSAWLESADGGKEFICLFDGICITMTDHCWWSGSSCQIHDALCGEPDQSAWIHIIAGGSSRACGYHSGIVAGRRAADGPDVGTKRVVTQVAGLADPSNAPLRTPIGIRGHIEPFRETAEVVRRTRCPGLTRAPCHLRQDASACDHK